MSTESSEVPCCKKCELYQAEIDRIRSYWAPKKIMRGYKAYYESEEVDAFLKAFVDMKAQLGKLPHAEHLKQSKEDYETR